MNEFKIIIDSIGQQDLDKTLKQLDDYKKNVQQINRETGKVGESFSKSSRGIQDELKKVTLEVNKLEKVSGKLDNTQQQALEALKKKQSELTKEAAAYKKAQTDVSKVIQAAYKQTNGLLDEQQEKLKELRTLAAQAQDPETLQKYNKEIIITSQRIKELKADTGQLNRSFDDSKGSYSDLVQRNKELRLAMNRLPIGDTSEEMTRLKREFNSNTQALKRFDAELGQNFRNVGNYEEAIRNAMQGLKGFGGALAGGIGGGGSGGSAASGILSGTGNALSSTNIPQLVAIGVVVDKLGEAVAIFDDIKVQLRDTNTILGVTGDELTNVTGKIRATVKVFEQDYNEVLRATNVLTETFGTTSEEAIDLINAGLIRGADISKDYLDQISEYSVQFKAAGLEAEQLVKISIDAADKGIFSDKAIDAVKEGTIRLREMTTATKAALDGIGLSGDEITKQLRNGEKSIGDIIAEVSKQLGTLKPTSAEVGTAIADIFGGPGEDAGLEFLLTLKDINKEFGSGFGPLSAYQEQQLALLESQQELDTALTRLGTSFASFGDNIDVFTNSVLAYLLNGLADLFELLQDTDEIVSRFGDSIAKNDNIDSLTSQLADLKQELEDVEPSFLDYVLSIGNVSQASINATKEKGKLRSEIALLEARIKQLNKATEDEEEEVVSLTTEQKKQIAAYRRLVDGARDYNSQLNPAEVKALAAAQTELAKASFEVAKAFEKIKGEGLQSTFDAFLDKQPEIATFLEAYEAAFEKSFLDPTKTIEEEYEDFVKRIEKQINKVADTHKEAEEKKTEATKAAEAERQRIVETSIGAAQDIAFSVFDLTSNLRDRQLQRIDQQMQSELALVQGNQEAQLAIAQKYDKKRAELARKQANAEKKLQLFNIAVNTATAIVKALASAAPPVNFVLAALVGAAGAVQAAAVLSQPIPKFRTGVRRSPEGLAYVGDGGEHETLIYPTGEMALTPNKSTLTYLPKNTQVLSGRETRELIKDSPELFKKSNRVIQQPIKNEASKQLAMMQLIAKESDSRTAQEIEKLGKKLTFHQYIPDERGLRRFQIKGKKRIESLNRRNSFLKRNG